MSGINSEILVLSQRAEKSRRKCQEKKTLVVEKLFISMKVMLTVFFTSRVLCIINSYVRDKQRNAGFISKSWKVHEKMSGEEDLSCGETIPGSSITTMHQPMYCHWFVISDWEIRKSLPEPGQVSTVAEEAQLCLCWPKTHKSVARHEPAHCHDGGTRSCSSTTEVSHSWHPLLDISSLRDNRSNSPFALQYKNSWCTAPSVQKKTVNMTFMLMNISHLE